MEKQKDKNLKNKKTEVINKDDKKKEDIHKGHRKRLTNLVFNAKLENVSEVQQVEYILTFSHPRKDMNPLAHDLLLKYGDFANIIDADYADLIQIDGIKDMSAKRLVSIRAIINLYNLTKLKHKTSLKNQDEFLKKLEDLLRYQDTELLYLLAFNNKGEITHTRQYDLKHVRRVGIEPQEIFSFLLSSHPVKLAIAHNHPGGLARSSDDDYGAVTTILNILENFDCELLDSFIVGSDGIYSDTLDSYIKYFDNFDNIINFNN